VAGALAVGSKAVFRWEGKHIFNPANFGIIALASTGYAWVSPGQWGNATVSLFFVATCGMLVTLKVGRWDAGAAFLAVLFCCGYGRTVLYQGWPLDHLLHSFSSGTLFLFAFFMITDPMTSPNARNARLIWGGSMALATFLLSTQVQLYTAPIWVLFGWCLITPFFDRLFVQPKFQWI
jgi:Na+-transporting NADH:ubiquinone oxidoreductase subunit NqrB